MLTISIAGFSILLKFWPIKDYPVLKKKFKKDLLQYLSGFEIHNNTKKNLPTINIYDKESFQLLYNKEKAFIEIANYKNNNVINVSYHIGITQFFIVLSNLIYSLLEHNDGFILHGSAALINGKANIFIGPNGSGKSTIIRLLKKKYVSLADDQIFIRKIKNNFYFFQNPHIENAPWIKKTHKSFIIENIYTLNKSTHFNIQLLSHEEGLNSLLQNLTTSKENQKLFIQNLFHFYKDIKCYELAFNLSSKELLNFFEKNG